MNKREKSYKIPFIICLVLIIINFIATLLGAYALFRMFLRVNEDLNFVTDYIIKDNLKKQSLSWDEAKERFVTGLNIEKPSDWVVEDVYEIYCTDYSFCEKQYVYANFRLGTKTTYNEFWENLKSKVIVVSNGDFNISNYNGKYTIEFFMDKGLNNLRKYVLSLTLNGNEVNLEYIDNWLYPTKIRK